MSGFRFTVEKIISIPGRGIVVTGRAEEGSVSVGAEIGFLGTDGQWVSAQVVAIEVSHRLVEEAGAGQQASLLVQGIKKGQIAPGMVLVEVPASPVPISSAPRPPEIPPPNIASAPPLPTSAKAIHPPSSLWRTAIFLIIGVLIILAILFLQGKLDSIKRIAGVQPSALLNEKFPPPLSAKICVLINKIKWRSSWKK